MGMDAKGQTVAAGDSVILLGKVTSADEDGNVTVELGDDLTEVDVKAINTIRANDGDDLACIVGDDGRLAAKPQA